MKILSMTATFGKLSHQTLDLNEGLNIIEAHNEWGKSTWCAFLMAMLYGIDTSSRTKTGYLADKEHYAPWNGEPMSGSMDILWNGKKITIQRQNKRVTPMGEVKAFETDTGIPVPELCVPAPGQVLLGVERSVFARAGFLKLSEMPVTEDESLRRRLNELVTTGDESGASDDLQDKLNKLKNKCKHNKTGLIPEAEAEWKSVTEKLEQLRSLQYQIESIQAQQETNAQKERRLENHKQALRYGEQLQYTQKLVAAQNTRDTAQQALTLAEQECKNLPSEDAINSNLARLQQLRETKDSLQTQSQLLPPLPPAPEAQIAFRGKLPETAVAEAAQDAAMLKQLKNDMKKSALYILGGALAAAGVVLAAISFLIPGAALLVAGAACVVLRAGKQKKLQAQIAELQNKYPGLSADTWEQEATHYAATQRSYAESIADRQQRLEDLRFQLEQNSREIAAVTGGENPMQFEALCRSYLQKHTDLAEKQRAAKQAEEVLQALTGAGEQIAPPAFEDTLQLTREETDKALADAAVEKHTLQHRLGQCQGQMDALGKEETLQNQKIQLENRIKILGKYYGALTLAQETLTQATLELQRRFAPRISGRAQELFSRMTGGRYQRLSLRSDLSLESGTQEEVGLRNTLWRSDGTVDQLYLALRLAVTEELTPDAPLVLDDALVRFDDTRLKQALEILQEMSETKQVILFTCQSREKAIQEREAL